MKCFYVKLETIHHTSYGGACGFTENLGEQGLRRLPGSQAPWLTAHLHPASLWFVRESGTASHCPSVDMHGNSFPPYVSLLSLPLTVIQPVPLLKEHGMDACAFG